MLLIGERARHYQGCTSSRFAVCRDILYTMDVDQKHNDSVGTY